MLLVFTALARAHSVADKLSACFAISSSSPKLETRRCRSSTSSNKLSPSALKAHSDGPPPCLFGSKPERDQADVVHLRRRVNSQQHPLEVVLWNTDDPDGSTAEPTNYTKLSKQITAGAENLANLSPYNPVVCETTKDFNQPTYKPRLYKFSIHRHICHRVHNEITNTSKFKT
jgi:hypothetical protein